jgi:HK97 family phage major capsid protein
MPVPNNDISNNFAERITAAAASGNQEEMQQALVEMMTSIQNDIVNTANSLRGVTDAAVLAQRGVRQLTNKERKFYENFIENAKANKPLNALTNADKTIPETIIEAVFEDIKEQFPLLAAIDSLPVTGLTKILLSADAGDSAVWGALNAEITKEITAGFIEFDVASKKLSAFLPVSNDMLALGATWLDLYVRRILTEALSVGMINGVVDGDGKDAPIGMTRDVSDNVVITGGVYPRKTAIKVTDLSPATYGDLISRLAKNRNGKDRTVTGLGLIVNPTDYYKLIVPATTILVNGTYVNDVLPVPTEIHQAACVPAGHAVLGILKNYFFGIAAQTGVQFSDEYHFLEDERVYKIKLLGNGRAKNDTDFLYLDISDLEPLYQRVAVIGTDDDEGI